MSMELNFLKPCERCGGEGHLVIRNTIRQQVAVRCSHCGIRTEWYFCKHKDADDKGVQNAIDDWNNWEE